MLGYHRAGLFGKELRCNIAMICGQANVAETTFQVSPYFAADIRPALTKAEIFAEIEPAI